MDSGHTEQRIHRVAVTGITGSVGTALRKHLGPNYHLIGIGRHRKDLDNVHEFREADVSDREQVRGLFGDVDAVIHLAADASPSASWDSAHDMNMRSDFNVLDECARARVTRVIYASSNHVHNGKFMIEGEPERIDPSQIGAHNGRTIDVDHEFWPDSLYGVSKVCGEALCRYYAAKHGLSVVVVRIGWLLDTDSPLEAPEKARDYARAMYLSHRDCGQLFDKALTMPIEQSPPLLTVFGISANERRMFSLEKTQRLLKFEPVDNADDKLREEGLLGGPGAVRGRG